MGAVEVGALGVVEQEKTCVCRHFSLKQGNQYRPASSPSPQTCGYRVHHEMLRVPATDERHDRQSGRKQWWCTMACSVSVCTSSNKPHHHLRWTRGRVQREYITPPYTIAHQRRYPHYHPVCSFHLHQRCQVMGGLEEVLHHRHHHRHQQNSSSWVSTAVCKL